MDKLLTLYDVSDPKSLAYILIPDTPCNQIDALYASYSDTVLKDKLKLDKPLPPTNKKWAVDLLCLFNEPLWAAGVNGGNSLSVYAKSAANKPLTVVAEKINVVPPVAPVEKLLLYDAKGYSREGLNANSLPNWAALLTGITPGTYRLTLKDTATNVVLDSQIVPLTENSPQLVTWVAPNAVSGSNAVPTVSNPVADYNTTIGSSFSLVLPSNQFTDSDGTIVSRTVTGLPNGLTYNDSSRTISGTSTAVGAFLVSVTATDNQGATVTDQFIIVVAAKPTGQITNGRRETYNGTLICPPGLCTNPEIFKPKLVNFDVDKGFIRNEADYNPPSNKRLLFYFGAVKDNLDPWYTQEEFYNEVFLAGTPYLVVVVEVGIYNFNPYTYIQESPFKAECSFIIH